MNTNAPAASEVVWHQADHTVYSGIRDGQFAGYITTAEARYSLHGQYGQHLGDYRTLDEAQDAIEHSRLQHHRTRRRRGPSRHRPWGTPAGH
ncbi:hypothetical protein [Rothia halotolerans]|uniref:hypothetical protein n=1 Tax=Rothia halotolerans TaxID=405770 RepID=UPI00101BEE86|nr:hypothetical protein [Rothia halotolerans]